MLTKRLNNLLKLLNMDLSDLAAGVRARRVVTVEEAEPSFMEADMNRTVDLAMENLSYYQDMMEAIRRTPEQIDALSRQSIDAQRDRLRAQAQRQADLGAYYGRGGLTGPAAAYGVVGGPEASPNSICGHCGGRKSSHRDGGPGCASWIRAYRENYDLKRFFYMVKHDKNTPKDLERRRFLVNNDIRAFPSPDLR